MQTAKIHSTAQYKSSSSHHHSTTRIRIGTVHTHLPSWLSSRRISPSLQSQRNKSPILHTDSNILNTKPDLHRHQQSLLHRSLVITASGPAGGMNSGGSGPGKNQEVDTLGKKALVSVAVTYMLLIVILPFINVFVEVRT